VGAIVATAATLGILRVAVLGCGGDSSSSGGGCPFETQTSCGGACVYTAYDPANCGGCGNACDSLSVCSRGTCQAQCGAGEAKCTPDDGGPAYCAVTDSDNGNCGACGQACPPTQACVGGKCLGVCAQGQQVCVGESGPPYCANVQSDSANCGACGHPCGPLEVCAAGACSSACVNGQTLCTGAEGGAPYCASTQTDNANCGTCGVVCGDEQVCAGGQCKSQCLNTQTLCTLDGGVDAGNYDGGPYCANTGTDSANCGACFNVCPYTNPICSNGTCMSGG
jgi:hypothetical protein